MFAISGDLVHAHILLKILEYVTDSIQVVAIASQLLQKEVKMPFTWPLHAPGPP